MTRKIAIKKKLSAYSNLKVSNEVEVGVAWRLLCCSLCWLSFPHLCAESGELEGIDTAVAVVEETAAVSVFGISPASSLVSLYSSDRFYSDAESDDEYKDPVAEQYHSQVCPVSFFSCAFLL